MFTIREVKTGEGVVQYRREHLTGIRCRVSTERIKRGLDGAFTMDYAPDGCPFCPDLVLEATPTFENGSRIHIGESITFPNLFPFADQHTVTVITASHSVRQFTDRQIADALRGQVESLKNYQGYPSINWNFLPSAGASLVHPHMQGMADAIPSVLAERYILGSNRYYTQTGSVYWDDLRENEYLHKRLLFEDEIYWVASAVPLGEREIRGVLPIRTIQEFEPYIDAFSSSFLRILELYRRMGNYAFNLSLFFDRSACNSGFKAFCSIVARINPNPLSTADSAFMERLHLEPVILTLPEELAEYFREQNI